ncbi:MAG: hypothetical protein DRH17_05955 [Deltaproteobacteria bacterium]|nr:MAG: hypothetical protein DRH17_05955 [Deltaproteobacteria bacterium]
MIANKTVKIFALLLISFLMFSAISFAGSGDEAERLWELGDKVYKAGKYQEALSYFEKSLSMCRKLDELEGISANLNSIGLVYWSLGQHRRAIHYYEESLKIDEKLNNRQYIAFDLNNIGEAYRSLCQYDKALSYHKDALSIREQFDVPQDIAESLNNIGMVYYSLGHYDKALIYFDKALNVLRKINNQQYIAYTLNNIGESFFYLGQYEKALSYLEASLKIRRHLNIPQDIALALNNIGGVYGALGQYEKGLNYHEEALNIYQQLNMPYDVALILNNIAEFYRTLGQYQMALNYNKESLRIRKQLNIPEDIAQSMNNMGLIYLALKDYRKAEEFFIEAEREQAKTGIWRGNTGLVEVYLATGQYEDAIKLLKKMTPQWNDTDPYRIQYYTLHGLTLKGKGMLKDASYEFLKAVNIIEEMRQKVKGEKSQFLGADERIRSYRGLIATLAERAIKGEVKDKNFSTYGKNLESAAFYFSESTKARTLVEAMAESAKKSQCIEIPAYLKEREQSLLNQLAAIERQWEDAYKKGEDILKRLKERKEILTGELDHLIKELRQKYTRYAALHYPKPIPPEDLPLKEDEVLLEYAITKDAVYLFVTRKAGVNKLIKIPVTKEELEEKIKTFMEPMNTREYNRFSVKDAKSLYDLLLSEALKHTHENEKIIIVPDGILGLLPFESLVKEGNRVEDSLYVSDACMISYYQSATVLSLQRNLKGKTPERVLFALGNPIYSVEDPRYIVWKENKNVPFIADLDQYAFRGLAIKPKWGKITETDTTGNKVEFPPLPETELEVKEIAKIMDVTPEPPDVLLSVSASETGVRKARLEKYRYIHFASHASLPGMIQGINEPFILLGQVENQGNDDGFFTLSEVLDLKLNADIVILSACVTGVGKEVEGEGVVNFARAFQHAGAKAVVVSLWEVASKPAVEYMKIFYGHLKAGKGRSEALRLTRNEIKAKYPNPFFWAVFILHGEG